MVHVVGIPNCNKIRETKAWLETNEVEYTFINVKKEPLTEDELRELVEKVGLDVLVNRKGMMWRKLGLKDQDLNEEELFEKLLEHQNMIKRPVLIKEEAVMVGYDEEGFDRFLLDNSDTSDDQ